MHVLNERINRDLIFATKKHGEQKRLGGIPMPYIFHPVDVAQKVFLYSGLEGEELVLAGESSILHDVLEDTDATEKEVSNLAGKIVLADVKALTKDDHYKGSKKAKMWENLGRIKDRPDYVACVKLADRASNLSIFPGFWNREKISSYLDESEMIHETLSYASSGLSGCLSNRIQECRLMLSIARKL